jgi:hypothetical protein
MIKLYFVPETRSKVIGFVNESFTNYAWVLRDNFIEIHGLSDANYVYNKFAEKHDYAIQYDIVDIKIEGEKIA